MNRIVRTTLIAAFGLATIASLTPAALGQGAGRANRFLPAGRQPQAPPAADTAAPGPRHPGSPIVAALDVNQDGVIDAAEIANAAAALATLDTNGDGVLTVDEIRPPHAGPGPRGGRRGGPRPDCPLNPDADPTAAE